VSIMIDFWFESLPQKLIFSFVVVTRPFRKNFYSKNLYLKGLSTRI
jgi:hypothetical protein